MKEFTDKLILLLCCTTLYLFQINSSIFIVPVMISIILSCLFIYYDKPEIRLIGIILFAILCLFLPDYIIFLPFLLYDTFHEKYQLVMISIPLLMIYHGFKYNPIILSFTILFLAVSYLLKGRSHQLQKLISDYNNLRDSSTKMSLLLEEKNRDLLKNQDNEINLATLNERSRISKEIHDNIGHLLSRSLLQVGALLVVSKDETVRQGLSDLKESLSSGMDQIRSSIHNMYDESVDLYVQLENLVNDFCFCDISYDYDIKNPPILLLRYCLIAITKEALANIIRHSNATKVMIKLREHPAMYQLVIQDNGTIDSKDQEIITDAFEKQEFHEGIGLHNIYDRVKSFDGNVNVNVEHGFKLFISIPKKTV